MSPRQAKPQCRTPLAEAALVRATALVVAAVPRAVTTAAAARADLLFIRFLLEASPCTPSWPGMPGQAARAGNARPAGAQRTRACKFPPLPATSERSPPRNGSATGQQKTA